jgi:hypothetical protein
MKQKVTRRNVLRILTFFFVFSSLIAFSILPSTTTRRKIHLPLIHRLWPGEPGLRSPILITEVMYDPPGNEPDHEWIELYNRGYESINLVNYKIGDSETAGDLEGMYHFPQETIIGPGQVIVIANHASFFSQYYGFFPDFEFSDSQESIPNMVKDKTWASGNVNLNNGGDEILLINQEGALLDVISWGDSTHAFNPSIPLVGEGHSLERKPADYDGNQAVDWTDQSEPQPGKVDLISPTPTATITATFPSPSCENAAISISEVMYDAGGVPDPRGEWIELFNWGDISIDLGCLIIGDEEMIGGGEGMLAFPFGSTILPGEIVVIANQSEIFYSIFGFNPTYEIIDTRFEIPDMVKFDIWATGSVNLSNSGDDVLILDMNNHVIDAVSWGNSNYAFDPSVPGVDTSHSLERRPGDQDTDSAIDWHDQSEPNPGNVDLDPTTPPPSPTNTSTPTQTLTPFPTIPDLVINEIHADPDSDHGDANSDGDIDFLDDEFVEIVNNSPTPIDLGGWTLGDFSETRHTFPFGSVIPPGCGVVIFGGGDPDGSFGNSLVQVASSGKLALNEHWEVVNLYNASAAQVASYTYGEEGSDNQSITRVPDIIGEAPLVKHSIAPGSNGSLFSPGTKIDGSLFTGCSD